LADVRVANFRRRRRPGVWSQAAHVTRGEDSFTEVKRCALADAWDKRWRGRRRRWRGRWWRNRRLRGRGFTVGQTCVLAVMLPTSGDIRSHTILWEILPVDPAGVALLKAWAVESEPSIRARRNERRRHRRWLGRRPRRAAGWGWGQEWRWQGRWGRVWWRRRWWRGRWWRGRRCRRWRRWDVDASSRWTCNALCWNSRGVEGT